MIDSKKIECEGVSVDIALVQVVEAYKANIGEFAATICEVAKRVTADTDQKLADFQTYVDRSDEATAKTINEVNKRLDALITSPAPGLTPEQVLELAKNEALKVVNEALALPSDAQQNLQILLTLVQEAPELKTVAALLTRFSDLEGRVKALESGQITKDDLAQIANCASIGAVVALGDALASAMTGFRTAVMDCAFPQVLKEATK